MSVSIKESSGIVTIGQIRSQAVAAHICCRFQQDGVAARVGMLPGVAGYHVIVPQLGVDEIERILRELRIEPRHE